MCTETLKNSNYSGVRSQEPESRIEAVYASSNLPTVQKFEAPKVGSELKLREKTSNFSSL